MRPFLTGLCLLAVFVAGSAATPAAAVVIVSYDSSTQTGGNMPHPSITSGLELDGDGNSNDGIAKVDLDTTTPYSGFVGDYNGPAFFLGFKSTQYNTGEGWDTRDSNPLSIRNQISNVDGFGNPKVGDNHLVVYFEAAFAGSYWLDSSSSMSIDTARFESLGQVRWLVRNGSDFYVSQSLISGDTTLAGSDLVNEMWAAFDPVADVNFDAAGASFSTATGDLTDLNAFGLVTDKDELSGVRHWLEIRGFTVNAVPEPATLALLAIGGLGVAIRRRR